MGLLDDAIREHLELKRRRGADPGEIERLEREALGPVRRPGYEANEMTLAEESAPEMGEPDDQATQFWPGPGDEPEFPDRGAEFVREAEDWGASDISDTVLEPEVAPPTRPVPPPPAEPSASRRSVDEDEFLEPETVEHEVEAEDAESPDRDYPGPRERPYPEPPADGYPEPRAGAYPEPPAGGHADPQERGYAAPPEEDRPHDSDEDDSQPREEQDDMLEETPEFLQDTPDHDRLWFEQRPPRDFDLDG